MQSQGLGSCLSINGIGHRTTIRKKFAIPATHVVQYSCANLCNRIQTIGTSDLEPKNAGNVDLVVVGKRNLLRNFKPSNILVSLDAGGDLDAKNIYIRAKIWMICLVKINKYLNT